MKTRTIPLFGWLVFLILFGACEKEALQRSKGPRLVKKTFAIQGEPNFPAFRNADSITYHYNGEGRLAEEQSYRENVVYATRLYAYDEEGRLVEENVFFSSNLYQSIRYQYEENQTKPTSETAYLTGDDDPNIHILYTYDDAGQLVKEEHFNAAFVANDSTPKALGIPLFQTIQYFRRSDGQVYLKTENTEGTATSNQFTFLYDDYGRLLENRTNGLTTLTYLHTSDGLVQSFDAAGNWIEEDRYEGGKLLKMERKLLQRFSQRVKPIIEITTYHYD